jgi:hypothetical protein
MRGADPRPEWIRSGAALRGPAAEHLTELLTAMQVCDEHYLRCVSSLTDRFGDRGEVLFAESGGLRSGI